MNLKNLLISATLAIAVAAASSAQAHAKLESSQPQAASLQESSPKQIRLQFNETLEPAFSKIRLVDANDAAVALSEVGVDKANSKAMSATVPPLHSGPYRVQWSTVSHDGHTSKGEFTFRVK